MDAEVPEQATLDKTVANQANAKVRALSTWLESRIIGQETLVRRLLMALLCGGHLLVEGAPGLAKTRAIKELASRLTGDFHRVQFTPDLLPSDITGTEIFRPETADFRFQRGPIFHNLILADEVNRAPAKVQAALLEAMAERQVSIGRETYQLPDLFLVMATQNPIEQEGTYPLPEAQLDRFLMHVEVTYPSASAELDILRLVRSEQTVLSNRQLQSTPPLSTNTPQALLTEEDVFAARRSIFDIYMAPAVEQYIIQLVMATRERTGVLAQQLDYGVSPRASIGLDQTSRALAWLDGRDFVTPEDVQAVCHDVFRHRLIISFDAEAQGISANQIIDTLRTQVPVG
jgi:MoxR-like ATPase